MTEANVKSSKQNQAIVPQSQLMEQFWLTTPASLDGFIIIHSVRDAAEKITDSIIECADLATAPNERPHLIAALFN